MSCSPSETRELISDHGHKELKDKKFNRIPGFASSSSKETFSHLSVDWYSQRLEPMSIGATMPQHPYFSTILKAKMESQ